MPALRSLLDFIPFIRVWRAREAVADAEAFALLQANSDGEAAYRQARNLSRLARAKGDLDGAKLYARVAVRIASVTDRRIGELEQGEARYRR
jgi:hypothetical protein